MTLINRLIKEAKASPAKLIIRDKDVSKIAQHFVTLSHRPVDKASVEAGIRAGDMKVLGVPVEVARLQ